MSTNLHALPRLTPTIASVRAAFVEVDYAVLELRCILAALRQHRRDAYNARFVHRAPRAKPRRIAGRLQKRSK